MDVKQIDLGNSNSIKRLISFVNNLEEKLLSVKTVHDKLNELLNIVSKTHENIIEELITIKNVLNQQNQLIKIDENKNEWNDDDNEQIQSTSSIKKFDSKSLTNLTSTNSPSTHQTDRLTLSSSSSYESSSTNSLNIENRPNSSNSKRSSNLKKVDQSSTRIKSPKSVTFSLQDNQKQINSNEIINQNSDLIPNLFKQHHFQVTNKQNIGFKLGNALTNVRIHEIESIHGNYLRLLNISNSDDYDLSQHYLQQNIACVPLSRFKFPINTIIRAGQTITIWCGTTTDIEPQPPHIFIWKEQKKWETGPECVTILAKPNGQAIAWARSSNRINTDQSSSDILFVHSKSNHGTSDISTISPTNFKNRSRLSSFNFIGNNKPPFAHSPSNPIHPNHNGGYSNDLRSQMHQKGGISQLLNRPKSSPFSSHPGCKQDLITMNFLRTQQNKQTTIKT